MEEERERESLTSFFPPSAAASAGDFNSDLDFSFNSTASTSTFASSSSSSARSSLSLSLPSFSNSTTLIAPLPHSRSNSSPHWSAVRAAASLSRDGALQLRHLHLLRHLGSGHLARVFLCRLNGFQEYDFALKVVDLAASKMAHVRAEARVLSCVDHPFLPTLYARIDASHYACFLIDYCPGGDLHSLLARHHRLPLHVVRFVAAEVLLAIEYLHALGFVYRDLKPENVLLRSDGHVMLSDFDLCLDGAYSRECVGTHEYVAPEMAGGEGHGKGVDWWAFGVFVYELLYGRTPFKGPTKEATLKNILSSRDARFPDGGGGGGEEEEARDMIRRLLVRDAGGRMGSRRGAAEIKAHPFFHGVSWPLIRSQRSPLSVGPAGPAVVRERRKRTLWSMIVSKCRRGVKSKRRLTRQKAAKL